MPYEITVPMLGQKPWQPGFHDQRAMHAVFTGLFSDAPPEVMAQIHPPTGQPDNQLRPFTQALLAGRKGIMWRVTLLDDALYEPFREGLEAARLIEIGRHRIVADHEAAGCRHVSYAELAAGPVRKAYTFRFKTPTSFKQTHRHYPIPDPIHCFSSWWTRWDAFAPAELGINIAVRDIVGEHLAISTVALRSRLAEDGPRRIVGCVGRTTFLPLRMHLLDESWTRAIATLAAFAPLCGTGHKTPQGMGQTRLVD